MPGWRENMQLSICQTKSVHLISDRKKFKRAILNASYKKAMIVNNDQALEENLRAKIMLKKSPSDAQFLNMPNS